MLNFPFYVAFLVPKLVTTLNAHISKFLYLVREVAPLKHPNFLYQFLLETVNTPVMQKQYQSDPMGREKTDKHPIKTTILL
jgi:hypothetical protein